MRIKSDSCAKPCKVRRRLGLNQPPVILRLPILAALLAFLLMAGAGCQNPEPETATPIATEAAPTIAPTLTPGRTNTPEPSRPEATTPTVPAPLTNTPIPAPAATPAPTPESDADFAALYQLLARLEGDIKVGDLLDALAESEVSCLRSRVDDAIYNAMTQEPALAFATTPQFLTTSCIETDRETDIAVALFAEAVGGLPAETEWCIGNAITENYGDDPFKPLSVQPLYMNCLNEEQFFELSVSELAGKAGGVDDDAKGCLRQVLSASFGASSELQSGNPQDGMGITIAFREAAIYGCLGNDQVAIVAGPDVTISDSNTECLRHLYTREFPKLYNDIGPRIFGSSLDLTPQELAAVESFQESRAECHVSPAVTYPTPDAPAPTLRPGIHTEPPSTIESNSSFKDYIDSRGAHQASCLRDRIGVILPDHDAYMARPAIVLLNHHFALTSCLDQTGMVNAVVSMMATYGVSSNEVRECLHREFGELTGFTEYLVTEYPHWIYYPPYLRCLTEGDYQTIAVAQLAALSGKLTPDSESCVREIAADGFNISRTKDIEDGMEYFGIAAMTLCLSDERLNEIKPYPLWGSEWPWPPRDRECVRKEYDEMVERLWIEANSPSQSTNAKDPIQEFYEDAPRCLDRP